MNAETVHFSVREPVYLCISDRNACESREIHASVLLCTRTSLVACAARCLAGTTHKTALKQSREQTRCCQPHSQQLQECQTGHEFLTWMEGNMTCGTRSHDTKRTTANINHHGILQIKLTHASVSNSQVWCKSTLDHASRSPHCAVWRMSILETHKIKRP